VSRDGIILDRTRLFALHIHDVLADQGEGQVKVSGRSVESTLRDRISNNNDIANLDIAFTEVGHIPSVNQWN